MTNEVDVAYHKASWKPIPYEGFLDKTQPMYAQAIRVWFM